MRDNHSNLPEKYPLWAYREGEQAERDRIKSGADDLPYQIIEGMRYVALASVRGLCDGTPGRGL